MCQGDTLGRMAAYDVDRHEVKLKSVKVGRLGSHFFALGVQAKRETGLPIRVALLRAELVDMI